MIRVIPRAATVALLGALAGPACLFVLSAMNPAVVFGTDRALPPVATGFYAVERNGRETFVWTSGRAEVVLPDLDRRSRWACSIRFRGVRPESLPQPDLTVAVDGVPIAARRASPEFQDLEVVVPASNRRTGLALTFAVAPTFVPGRADPRILGVQVAELGCRPLDGGVPRPPSRALGAAALAAAAFGAVFGLAALSIGWAFLATLLLATLQAIPLTSGAAQFGPYVDTFVRLAVWVALPTFAALGCLELARGRRVSHAARFVLAFSGAALYLKLLGLLHPSKLVVDALFHAHRFDAVLAGNFYFTQLSTSATPFPYAIGLYLFAAPWSWLTSDHVSLLRIVVCASEVGVGALLYVLVARAWEDRLAGALAVVLANLVPVVYAIVGNANLTQAFGQSVALATMIAVTAGADRGGRAGYLLRVTLLATCGFICHVGVVVLLLATLVAVAALFRWAGGPELRAAARSVLIATMVALGLSVALYWGHFGPVYAAQFERARAMAASVLTPATAAPEGDQAPEARQEARTSPLRARIPIHQRVLDVFRQTLPNFGWPILVLALVGAWRLAREGPRDRLTLALAAWGVVAVGFLALSVLTPVDPRFQQDAWEFIGRVELATAPAVVILAGRGAAWAWRNGLWPRLAAAASIGAALLLAFRAWRGWLP
jgi:hypothetical protein